MTFLIGLIWMFVTYGGYGLAIIHVWKGDFGQSFMWVLVGFVSGSISALCFSSYFKKGGQS